MCICDVVFLYLVLILWIYYMLGVEDFVIMEDGVVFINIVWGVICG